ncbi:MAG TPA: hypothetical protein VHP38_02125 [Ruminiclostridium sp.]|nr:hypothetical protein [Ruminiclostridium sp.]
MPKLEAEYYERYKEILDRCIPKDVLNRLLNKTVTGEQRGDAWEPDGKYYDESGEELPF